MAFQALFNRHGASFPPVMILVVVPVIGLVLGAVAHVFVGGFLDWMLRTTGVGLLWQYGLLAACIVIGTTLVVLICRDWCCPPKTWKSGFAF